MSTRLHIVAPEELVARIDAAKGPGQSRGDWIRRAAERALSEAKGPITLEQADPGPVSSPEDVRSAAPAQWPTEQDRQMFQAPIRDMLPKTPPSRAEMFRHALRDQVPKRKR